jgi:glycerol uptake facilitator-like aquaporin
VRSLAPALLGGDLSKLWIYLVAPVVGAVIGALVFRAVDQMAPPPSAT